MIYWAKVRTQFAGIHCYPDAPAAVEFLRFPHRHVFHVTLTVEQFHTERDVEYLMLKNWLEDWISSKVFGPQASCERMAEAIGQAARTHIGSSYPHPRRILCEVTEDGENGALVEM